jgi:hypothetical protein
VATSWQLRGPANAPIQHLGQPRVMHVTSDVRNNLSSKSSVRAAKIHEHMASSRSWLPQLACVKKYNEIQPFIATIQSDASLQEKTRACNTSSVRLLLSIDACVAMEHDRLV